MTTKITREQFMNFFRDDELHEHLTTDDCLEIFINILPGASDITPELIDELKDNYGIDDTASD